jgi:hypothetical protein
VTHVRPHVAAIAVALVGACTEAGAPDFDGEYRVSVEQTANTCDAGTIGDGTAGLTTRLDLFRRSDGTYDLRWVDGWVPAELAFAGVDLGTGQVADGIGTASQAVGEVEPDAIDLELVHRGTRLDDGAPCERRVHVRGRRRPMFELDGVDGRYIVAVEHRGGTCADGTAIAAAGAWNMRMEVLPFRDDRTSVVIEDLHGGLLRFWIEPLGGGGGVHLTRDVFFAADRESITPLDGIVEGTIEPDRIALTARIVATDDPSACETSYAISGSRWLPSLTSVHTEYRTTYRMTDTCDPSYQVTYEDVALAVGQVDGRLDLIDREIQSTVLLDGATVSAAFGPDGSLTYRGTVGPDRASYVVEDRYTVLGHDCVFALTVDGAARY